MTHISMGQKNVPCEDIDVELDTEIGTGSVPFAELAAPKSG